MSLNKKFIELRGNFLKAIQFRKPQGCADFLNTLENILCDYDARIEDLETIIKSIEKELEAV